MVHIQWESGTTKLTAECLPAVVSLMSLRALRPAIVLALRRALRWASVKKDGTWMADKEGEQPKQIKQMTQ